MSAETINPDDWQSTVIELCRPMIEQLQQELDAADWCHPHGACILREYLDGARKEASSGRVSEVHRLLNLEATPGGKSTCRDGSSRSDFTGGVFEC
jgi:hypothetical protein